MQPLRLKQTAGQPRKRGRPAAKWHYILADLLYSYEVAKKSICEVENYCSFDESADHAEDIVQYTDHRQTGEYVYGREDEVEYAEGARHYDQQKDPDQRRGHIALGIVGRKPCCQAVDGRRADQRQYCIQFLYQSSLGALLDAVGPDNDPDDNENPDSSTHDHSPN